MLREKFLLLILLLFTTGIAFAIDGNIEFDHYSPDDGLPNGYIQTFLHDNRGFMWIGTINGLTRFDGLGFRNYYHDPYDSTSLNASTINQLIEDDKGNIWILNNRGLCLYNRNKDNFIRIKLDIDSLDYDELYLSTGYIDNNNILWMALTNTGIIQLNLDKINLSTQQAKAKLYSIEEPDVEDTYKNGIICN